MRPLAWRFLKASLLVGAGFDALFALAILYSPDALGGLLGLQLPAYAVFLDLSAVFLLILALFHAVSAIAVEKAPILASAAAAGRLLGFFFFLSLWSAGHPGVYLGFALASALLAAAHGGFLVWSLAGGAPAGEAAR
jgi:hypothetical protein